MTQLELFAGIGGFGLAGHWAGIETVCQVEIDPFCRRVLKKNFPHAHQHDDIRTFDGRQWRGIDIVSGGFPCQPYSHAGQRKGNDDDRALWPEMYRVIREVAPAWVVGENVAGLITMDGGRVFDGILTDLENAGYSVETYIIPACAVGAPHRRDRVWIVAHRDGQREQQPKRAFGHFGGRTANGSEERVTANANIFGRQRRQDDERQESAGRGGTCVGNCTTADAGRRNGEIYGFGAKQGRIWQANEYDDSYSRYPWTEHWLPVATRLCRVDDGLSRRMDRGKRLKALGNAIVPQVAYQIFKAIIQSKYA